MDEESKELMNDLDRSIVAGSLLSGEAKRVLEKIADDAIEKGVRSLCFDNLTERQRDRVIERIRFLKYELFSGLNSLIVSGEFAFEELNDKGILRKPELGEFPDPEGVGTRDPGIAI